ncbi:PLP-dependent aminotransferase family protein [Bartonella sp. DGB1]|uniref:aminotransferase-like domain-containing protein n=1 Tax=Bartonella sp. DGB1 TaxID=3239807 RepID=UPI003525F376
MWDQILSSRMNELKPSELREIFKLLEQPDIIAFAGGVPNASIFPTEEFSKAYNELFATQADAQLALQYSNTEGYVPLRQWLKEHMQQLGINVEIDNILITSGSQQALDSLGKIFLSPGDTALVNWPTYLGAIQAFSTYEAKFQKLEGVEDKSAEEYKQIAKNNNSKIKFIYLSPDFANPTGITLTKQQRLDILKLAEDLNIAIIEDGAYQALRYEGEDIPSILSLELQKKKDIENTRTIYCGSFSKTISPGLRLGWVVANKKIIKKLTILKQAMDLNTSTINQIILHKVVNNIFDQHIEYTKRYYLKNRDIMLRALEKYMPEYVTWDKPEGGLFIWCKLPVELDTKKLFEKAVRDYRVAFVPGSGFFPDNLTNNMCRLSFSYGDEKLIEEGIKRIAKLIKASLE